MDDTTGSSQAAGLKNDLVGNDCYVTETKSDGTTAYVCKQCNKKTKTEASMKSHVKNKHELQPRKRLLNDTNEIESSEKLDDKKARLDTVSIEAGCDAEFDFGV